MKKLLSFVICCLINTLVMADEQGKTTYQLACKNCHAPQLAQAIKAPPAFDKKAWDERFKQAELEVKNDPKQFKTPVDYLLYSVKMGKGLMYHGGLCKEANAGKQNCSDDALIKAIHYMSADETR